MNRNSGIVRGIWLRMLQGGGRWTPVEVGRAMNIDHEYADKILRHMQYVGLAHKFQRPGRKNGIAYGITPECKVPNLTALQEIFSATTPIPGRAFTAGTQGE